MIDNVSRLRVVELELLREFSGVCDRHGLKWYAFFGTLLGAVREEGFLPWDDDVDVVMPAQDYRELCAHKDWFGEGLFLQTPEDEGFPNMAKLRKDGTTAFRRDFLDELRTGGHHGISIDIIPLAEIPGANAYHTPTLSSEKRNAVFLKDWFEPAGTARFEDLTVPVPGKFRKVLTESYGDWAWPVGADQCRPRYWFFDTETGYETYVKRYTGMLEDLDGKEIYLFGAADSLRVWLERFGRRDQVVCTFDNDPGKWGKEFFGVEVRDPAKIPECMGENSRLIIVSIWHQEIGRQLEKMGISDYYVYLDFYLDDKIGQPVIRRDDTSDGNTKIPRWRE